MRSVSNSDVIADWEKFPRQLAEEFGDQGDFARQRLLTPTILKLLGNPKGKNILDAGSGQGYLSRLLTRQGLIVTGIEPAKALIEYSEDRETKEPLGIRYIRGDLSTFTEQAGAFDVVIANMVFMDIPDYRSAMRSCIRALRVGGSFIFSLSHPCFEESALEWPKKKYVAIREYFAEYKTKETFGYTFHRPLSTYLNFVIDNGAKIERVVEPQLTPQEAKENPAYDRDVHVPSFFLVHAIKPPTAQIQDSNL